MKLHRLVLTLAFVLAGVAIAQAQNPFDAIVPSVQAAVITLLGGVLTWAAAQLSSFLRARAKATENELMRSVLTMVADQAGIAVESVAQRAVNKLKAAAADGRLTAEDALLALRAAVEEVWESIGKQAQEALVKEHGSEEEAKRQVIEPAIEAKVLESKVATPVKEPPVPEDAVRAELELARQRLRALL